MKIYMDVCCLNRPFDDSIEERVKMEAAAVLSILQYCRRGKWELAASDIIDKELSKSRNLEKLTKVRALYSVAKCRLTVNNEVGKRALDLQTGGIKAFDSLHLALAEIYHQDVLLTTDDAFLTAARRRGTATMVANPVSWLMEVKHYDCRH